MQRLGPGNAFRFRFALCPRVQVAGQSSCFPFRALDDFLLARASGGELPLRLLFFVVCFRVLDRFLGGEDLNLLLMRLSLQGGDTPLAGFAVSVVWVLSMVDRRRAESVRRFVSLPQNQSIVESRRKTVNIL